MALQRALEVLLQEIRAEIIALRQVKNQIKADLAKERGGDVPEKSWTSGDPMKVVGDLFEAFRGPATTERAVILADIASYELWGGARGWERADDAQFEILVERLKEKLRDGNQSRTPETQEVCRQERQDEDPVGC